jgi:uncharacterized protein involved in response to NO
MNKTPALLTVGFRPFFLITAIIGVLNPTLWASVFKGYTKVNLATDAMFWHGHEMLFGFTGALIAGFLLTASANWTGKKPISGFKLSLLIAVFLFGQISYFFPIDLELLVVVSNLFLPLLAIMLFFMIKFSQGATFLRPLFWLIRS